MKYLGQIEAGEDHVNKDYVDDALALKVDKTDVATDSDYGVVKTNSASSITLNADGQLEVGGRLGQFPGTTGIYAASDRDPRAVGDNSFLITDAMGMSLDTGRAFALVSGLGVACKSAAAGSTQYRVSNTYQNRLSCKMCEGGFAAASEPASKAARIIPVVSVTINGAAFTPSSAPNDTTTDIIITTAETLNPDAAITNVRLFGNMMSYSTAYIGNGIASWGGGRNLLLGGGIAKDGSGNDNCVVSNGAYVKGNGCAVFGRHHIVVKNRGFFAGSGHDSTNANGEGVSAIGQYSYIDKDTMFAIGNGTNQTTRLNLFEVLKDGSIVLRSPNGTRYKIAVADDGTLSTTAIT